MFFEIVSLIVQTSPIQPGWLANKLQDFQDFSFPPASLGLGLQVCEGSAFQTLILRLAQ